MGIRQAFKIISFGLSCVATPVQGIHRHTFFVFVEFGVLQFSQKGILHKVYCSSGLDFGIPHGT